MISQILKGLGRYLLEVAPFAIGGGAAGMVVVELFLKDKWVLLRNSLKDRISKNFLGFILGLIVGICLYWTLRALISSRNKQYHRHHPHNHEQKQQDDHYHYRPGKYMDKYQHMKWKDSMKEAKERIKNKYTSGKSKLKEKIIGMKMRNRNYGDYGDYVNHCKSQHPTVDLERCVYNHQNMENFPRNATDNNNQTIIY